MPHSSDSDSDTEDDKRRRQHLKESVDENQFAYKKAEPVATTGFNHNNQSTPTTGATPPSQTTTSTTNPTNAAPTSSSSHSNNPFYTLLQPPVPPFFSLPCQSVPEALKSYPLRVSFLARIQAQIDAERNALERRRRAGLHGLSSKRLQTTDDDGMPVGPRVFNAFELSMLKNLHNYLSRNLEIEDGIWSDETEEQHRQRLACQQALKQLIIMKKYPPGSFLESLENSYSATASPSPDPSSSTSATSATADELARKERKLAKKAARKAAEAADPSLKAETPEERKLRKEAKKEKKRKKAEEEGGASGASQKKAKKQKKEAKAQ